MSVSPFPLAIVPQGFEHELRHNVAKARSTFTGAVWRVARTGSYFAFRYQYRNLTGQSAAAVLAAVNAARGGASSFYLPVPGYSRRGSGFGSELLTNGTFASGTTGWTANEMTASAPDYVLRGTLTRSPSASTAYLGQGYSGATQYSPLAFRSVIHSPPDLVAAAIRVYFEDGTISAIDPTGLVRGLNTVSIVTITTTGSVYPFIVTQQAIAAGAYAESSFASLARCALVDNGPNLLLQSDEFDVTWSPVRATIDDQALVGPDGQTVADYLVEDGTAANTHYVDQGVTIASSEADYSFGVFLKSGNRTVALLEMVESTGSHTADAYFNLATGASGNVTVSGANWLYPRAYVVSCGNGWYYCCLVARKVSAGTTLTARIYAGESMGDAVFDGLAQNSIGMWRATLAQSSVPTRPVATTTTATSGTSQTGGALHLKGLPASTNGLLLAGDYVQIPGIDQLVRARTALNSDAAGLGYFEFEPMLRASPADSSPVIDVTPLGRFFMEESSILVSQRPGGFTDVDFVAVEDMVAA